MGRAQPQWVRGRPTFACDTLLQVITLLWESGERTLVLSRGRSRLQPTPQGNTQ